MEFPKLTTGQIAGGSAIAGVGVGLGISALVRARKKKKKGSKKKKTSNKNSRKRIYRSKKRKGKRYTPRTAGKGKDTSHKRIRYTKKGQPYIIKADGRARFIKQTSATRSHRQKGGRY